MRQRCECGSCVNEAAVWMRQQYECVSRVNAAAVWKWQHREREKEKCLKDIIQQIDSFLCTHTCAHASHTWHTLWYTHMNTHRHTLSYWLNMLNVSDDGWWMVQSTPCPLAVRSWRTRITLWAANASKPDVGSSTKRIGGSRSNCKRNPERKMFMIKRQRAPRTVKLWIKAAFDFKPHSNRSRTFFQPKLHNRLFSHNVVTMETIAIGWPPWLITFWYLLISEQLYMLMHEAMTWFFQMQRY